MFIGIDTHEDTLAVSCVDSAGREVAQRTFANTPAGHANLLAWTHSRIPDLCRVGVEGFSQLPSWRSAVPLRQKNRRLSAYDLMCRSGYDVTCRSRQGDHCRLSPPETRVRRSLSR